jgi:cyanate permease
MGVGVTLGAMLSATVLSPLLNGWRHVFFLYGFICFAIGVLWFLVKPEAGLTHVDTSSQEVSFRQVTGKMLRIRNLWFMSFGQFGFGGCLVGMMGYLPTYFKGIGWVPATADATLAILNIVSTAAAIPIAMLSDRLGLRKPILLVALIIMTLSVGLLSITDSALVWPLIICVGIFRDGFMAIMITTIIETRGVGTTYSGTAIGLVSAFQRLGGFISAPTGNSLAESGRGYPFIFWAGLALFSLIMFAFLREEKGAVEIETVR